MADQDNHDSPYAPGDLKTEEEGRTEPKINESSISHDLDRTEIIQKQLGEDLRITMNERNLYMNERRGFAQQVSPRESEKQQIQQRIDESFEKISTQIDNSSLKPKKGGNSNIFGKARTSQQKPREIGSTSEPGTQKKNEEKIERDFERKCLICLKQQDWNALDNISTEHLEQTEGKSFKGFFYLGISLYKLGDYESAIRAFTKAEQINSDDAQLQYNLGLSNFKLEQYNQAVDHFKKCTKVDPHHQYAFNNLAFLYNMHQFYQETINICGCAKLNNPQTHNCHRHWAFALFKKGEMAKAIKKIKKGIQKNPKDGDNWVVWGLIMRTVGNYQSAKHKFQKALKLDPRNETATFELGIVNRIIELDEQIPLDTVPSIKRQLKNGQEDPIVGGGCARSCNNSTCSIF